jgi:Flp pilus assembly protein TadG
MLYTLIAMTALFAMLGLAVDLSRAQTAKSELHRVADAAARAAVAALPSGTSAAQTAAQNVAALNNDVDGGSITINTSDIVVGNWSTSSGTFTAAGSPTNAVEVTVRRTTSNGNPITLMFSKVIGVNTVDLWATSTAALVEKYAPTTQYVGATSDPWLAGDPAGTQASEPDSEYPDSNHKWKYDVAGTYGGTDPAKLYSTDYSTGEYYGSPLAVNLSVSSGDIITLTNVSGYAYKGPGDDAGEANGDDYTAGGTIGMDSDEEADGVSEHGMSDITVPGDSMVGVFLGSTLPDDGTAPSSLDFSTQAERDYFSISPQLQQTFYAGTGTTSGSSSPAKQQQYITVPASATTLYLGSMDGHEWSNNTGGYTVTITDYQILTVQ